METQDKCWWEFQENVIQSQEFPKQDYTINFLSSNKYFKIKNNEESDYHIKKDSRKESANIAMEEVIYKKCLLQKHQTKTMAEKLIMDSGATSRTVNMEENMTNLKDT